MAAQIKYANDRNPDIGRIVKYRAPGIGQILKSGVDNTGPGVMYNEAGLVHGMDRERTSEDLAKANIKRVARQQRKRERETGGFS